MAGLLKGLGYRERPSLEEGRYSFLYVRLLIKDYLKHAGGTEKSGANVFRNTSRIQGRPTGHHIENTVNPLKGLPQEPHSPPISKETAL